MSFFHANRRFGDLARPEPSDAAETVPEEMLAPVIAGAYARGVADTLEMLDLPGLLLDGAGEVLHASRACAPLLRGPLRLRERHIVARHAEDNRVLAAFIADALGARAEADAVHLSRAALDLRRLPFTDASALPGQILRAVIVMADARGSRSTEVLRIPDKR